MTTMVGKPQQDPGDDSALLRAILPWALTTPLSLKGGAHVYRRPDGSWQLSIGIARGNGRVQVQFIDVDPLCREGRWSLLKLGPTVWEVSPSIHIPGQLHAFVTLVGVPNPAPWEG